MVVERARPRQAARDCRFHWAYQRWTTQAEPVKISWQAFGEKAYIFLRIDQRPVGLVGWQVENLVARTDDVYLEDSLPLANAMQGVA